MNRLAAVIAFSLFGIFSSCKPDDIDFGYTNFVIQPDDTRYFNLNIGNRGWEYFHGGYRGVIVFRISGFQFIAFERSCTVAKCHGLLEVDEDNNLLIRCQNCHNQYLYVDGTPLSGSTARRTLYQYCTHYDGETLSVFNCNQ